MASHPAVLRTDSLGTLLRHLLDHHAPPSTLVVCSSKEDFLQQLHSEVPEVGGIEAWSIPSLRLLSTSRTLKLAFVQDITHLRAYLATYSLNVLRIDQTGSDTALRFAGALPILAILNPIQLHRPTAAFSAQGLHRTFAAAVEAAHHAGSKLVLADLPSESDLSNHLHDEPALGEEQQSSDPWAEAVPILNVTTKRLGELSVGRTVKIKDIAGRWCTFTKLEKALDE